MDSMHAFVTQRRTSHREEPANVSRSDASVRSESANLRIVRMLISRWCWACRRRLCQRSWDTPRPDGSFGAPRRLFDRTAFLLNDYRFSNYQPSTDGKRFLMIRRDEGSAPHQLNVILNWSGEAERSTAAGNK